ncbi:F0F1 ATP synthase subunit delta [Candidatus Woesebacteria bacterium]|nr:F0F1 ATP synthase subunit delta [Candidatus Woesebacteria bacterium]
MQPSNLDSNLKQFLVTIDDKVAMLEAIAKLKLVQYSTNADALVTALANDVSYDVATALSTVLHQENPPSFSEIETWLTHLPVISLSLSFAPSRIQLQAYQEILQTEGKHPTVLLQVSVNPHLLAGVQVEINGTYRDYSLQTALDSFVQTPAYQAILTKHLQ